VFILTAWIVTGCEQDATSRFPLANDMARSWGTQDAIMADQELLDAIGSTNFGDFLNDLRVVVSAITANDKERAFNAFWY
jgi:hypothetical protein